MLCFRRNEASSHEVLVQDGKLGPEVHEIVEVICEELNRNGDGVEISNVPECSDVRGCCRWRW